jgi:hypothetical protein
MHIGKISNEYKPDKTKDKKLSGSNFDRNPIESEEE